MANDTPFISRPKTAAELSPAPVDQRNPKLSVLRKKKPDWNDKAEVWTDLHVLYTGGYLVRQNAMRFLRRRPKEDSNVYSARVDQITYQTLLGTGLGWYAAELFELAPEIGMQIEDPATGDAVEASKLTKFFYDHKFFKNCDRNGTSLTNFWRDMVIKMLIFGEVWALTDLPRPSEDPEDQPKSLQDQMNKGLLDPHLIAFTPLQVINYQEDEFGTLEWVVVQTTIEEQNFLSKPEVVDRWYYFDKTAYRVYEYRRKKDDGGETTVQATPSGAANMTAQNAPLNQAMAADRDPVVPMIAEGLHSLAQFNRCPIRRYKLPDNLWLANRAYLPLLDHLNQDNTLSWALFMANLAMPVIIGDVDLTNQILSEMGFIQLPEGCSYKWTEPEGKSFTVSANRVDQLREEIYRSMYLSGIGREQSKTAGAMSGFAKQMDFMAAHDILDSLGEVIIEGMQNMLSDVADARGDEGLVFDVRGFHFEEHVSLQEIETIDKAINMMIPSETFEKELYRLVVRAFLQDANPELFNTISGELKAGPTRLKSQMKMLAYEASLGMKPGAYLRDMGSNAPGELKISASGTPSKTPYSQDAAKTPPSKASPSTYQSAAGKARKSSGVTSSPTTRPGKK